MGLFNNKKKLNQKRLDAAMLAINSILNEIYSNKSTDEYKMKGDITKSPSYKDLEIMVADLKTLKGYNQTDAKDIQTMFNTLHRPIFKTMVKEYITEHNDRNTVFTSMFTIGYRLLTGELARIFASTEATEKGIVYKPDKVSRKKDASKMIKLFNDDLERKINDYVKTMHAHPEESPVNESYLSMIVGQLIQEADEIPGEDTDLSVDTADVDPEDNSADQVDTVTEEEEPGDADPDENSGVHSTDAIQEAAYDKVSAGLGDMANTLGGAASKITSVSKDITLIAASIAIIGGLFSLVNGLFKGFNPIADINYFFMNSYDKKIRKFEAVSSMYEETKKSYAEYMKIPPEQRKKKIESKYAKNMQKYNIAMQNLAAQIEHFNQRAEKESAEMVASVENRMPTDKPTSKPEGGDPGNTASNDDDFQF